MTAETITGQTGSTVPVVSVIIPARNEEASLGACLDSLVAQTRVSLENVNFEIIVVDDNSTDHTPEIAASFPNVRVIDAAPLPSGWTGKNNAVATGARQARGSWFLFTDADTVHLPDSLMRSLKEATAHGAAMLSYSPEQIVETLWEKTVMPVIFADLARRYRPSEVSNPQSAVAAANGQYILITREAYDAVGGHSAVATDLLEDVALARAVKRSGRKIFFRYGGDAVRTRMYRNFAQLREGWTKNLALLFPSPGFLAAWRLLEFVVFVASLVLAVMNLADRDFALAPWYLIPPAVTIARIRRAHFSWPSTLLAFIGLPLFAYLLLRSKRAHASGSVPWKGRTYCDKPDSNKTGSEKAALLAPGH